MKVLKMIPLMLLLAGSTTVQAQVKAVAPAQDQKDAKGIFTYVDKMPEFTGDVNTYLAKNINYPEKARKENIQGRSVVKFVIDETGKVQNAMVEVKANPMLDAEALRVVNSMPAWKPGMQNGKPVKVYYRIPVRFMLDGAKGKG